MVVRIQTESFDAAAEAQALSVGRTDIGAVVTFTRLCRGEEGIEAVILECYADMAEVEISRLVDVARARWPLDGVTVIHRYGPSCRVIPSCWW